MKKYFIIPIDQFLNDRKFIKLQKLRFQIINLRYNIEFLLFHLSTNGKENKLYRYIDKYEDNFTYGVLLVSMFLRNVFTAIQNDLDEQRQDTRQNSLAVDFRYMKNANLFIVAQYICSTHSYERQ